MQQNVDDDSGAIRLVSLLLRMHGEGQSHKQISDALDVSEAFVSRTVNESRVGWLRGMFSVLNTARDFVQHRRTWRR